jgi:hypothetical protein
MHTRRERSERGSGAMWRADLGGITGLLEANGPCVAVPEANEDLSSDLERAKQMLSNHVHHMANGFKKEK